MKRETISKKSLVINFELIILTEIKQEVIFITEGLILAQSERWRRVLGMQVERQQVCSNTDAGEWQTGE